MIALDTNILVYAHREDSPQHARAIDVLRSLAEDVVPFGIPWPCISEFLAVTTHPSIYKPASTTTQALGAVEALTQLEHLRLLGESAHHLDLLGRLVTPGVVGPKLHDARIAAICLGHGIAELWTADRDFSYFPALRTRNPLV